MPGPYPSDRHLGAHGLPINNTHPSEPLPPPLPYPRPRRPRFVAGAVLASVLLAALAAVMARGAHSGSTSPGGPVSEPVAKTAIQNYLNALQQRDTDAIARNTMCGLYDAVRDRRTDQALAKLSSDAFRKQFAEAKVATIDKIVYRSDYQAQVLFSMRVQSGTGSTSTSEVQGVAELLTQHNQVLVCSYVLRTSETY